MTLDQKRRIMAETFGNMGRKQVLDLINDGESGEDEARFRYDEHLREWQFEQILALEAGC